VLLTDSHIVTVVTVTKSVDEYFDSCKCVSAYIYFKLAEGVHVENRLGCLCLFFAVLLTAVLLLSL